MRRKRLRSLSGAFVAFRTGLISFDAVAVLARPHLRERAEYFLGRYHHWNQRMLGVEDLEQEMLLALWRAIDTWDPKKRADLARYIDAKVGSAAEHRLRQACGYPNDKRKRTGKHKTTIAVPVALEFPERIESESDVEGALERRRTIAWLLGEDRMSDSGLADVLYTDRELKKSLEWKRNSDAQRAVSELVTTLRAGG